MRENCEHRGENTTDLVYCESCGGTKTKLKVFPCAVHGRCVVSVPTAGVAGCYTCPDYKGPEEIFAEQRFDLSTIQPDDSPACKHMGDMTGRFTSLPSCQETLRMPVRTCDVHGECVKALPAPGYKWCGDCSDRG